MKRLETAATNLQAARRAFLKAVRTFETALKAAENSALRNAPEGSSDTDVLDPIWDKYSKFLDIVEFARDM
jgi:hypothetical protein